MKKKTNDTVRASALQIALALALLLSSASLLALACFGQSPSATPTPMECGKIAFHKAVNGIFRIFVMRPDGSGVTDLTDGFLPAFSRDGNKIAFIRLHDIWIMNADGSNQAQVTSGIPLSDLALSSDGSKIVFARYVNVNGTT
ncbi:MAG: TolB family protein, partial [Chthoniobacterales bacterium]